MFEALLSVGGKKGSDSSELIAGDITTGFYGEVDSGDFINGVDLASAVNLNEGPNINTTGGWLKFSLDGAVLYVAKQPLKYMISHETLRTKELLYGNTEINIKGKRYKVRLLKTASTDPTSLANGNDLPLSYGSEWNRLMYRVSDLPGNSAEGIQFGSFWRYSDYDLSMSGANGYGYYQWCQEKATGDAFALMRGHATVKAIWNGDKGTPNYYTGWRPVLELVE